MYDDKYHFKTFNLFSGLLSGFRLEIVIPKPNPIRISGLVFWSKLDSLVKDRIELLSFRVPFTILIILRWSSASNHHMPRQHHDNDLPWLSQPSLNGLLHLLLRLSITPEPSVFSATSGVLLSSCDLCLLHRSPPLTAITVFPSPCVSYLHRYILSQVSSSLSFYMYICSMSVLIHVHM